MKSWNRKCTGIIGISQVRRRRSNPINANPKEKLLETNYLPQKIWKLIVLKPKVKLIQLLTSLIKFGMVDFGTIVPTSFMTAHVRGHWKQICDIKTGNGMIVHMVKNQQWFQTCVGCPSLVLLCSTALQAPKCTTAQNTKFIYFYISKPEDIGIGIG